MQRLSLHFMAQQKLCLHYLNGLAYKRGELIWIFSTRAYTIKLFSVTIYSVL
jgi:hypothetical protein